MSTIATFTGSRRQLFDALLGSASNAVEPATARRRPGRTGLRELDLPVTPQALTVPPPAIRWLTRATHGFSLPEHAAFLALGGDDETCWAAWLAQQLNPAGIDDSACDNRIASAAFQTLGMTVPQLWTRRNQIGGSNYFERMRPIAEVEAATIIRQIYSRRQLFEVMVGFARPLQHVRLGLRRRADLRATRSRRDSTPCAGQLPHHARGSGQVDDDDVLPRPVRIQS